MIEAGLTEKEAMEVSGHKTRSVFDRSHIVSERRLEQLGEKMDAHMKGKEREAMLPVNIASEKSNVC